MHAAGGWWAGIVQILEGGVEVLEVEAEEMMDYMDKVDQRRIQDFFHQGKFHF